MQGALALMSDVHPATGQPIGPRVDAQPAAAPAPVTLTGRFGTVERLDPARHRAGLWQAVSGHDKIWTYMAYGPFADEAAFSDWLTSRVALTDPYYYAIVEPSGRAVGLATLMSIRPDMRVVEVGNILLSPAMQRTPLASEAQYLLARYAFETLRYRRYEWKCDALNAASRRAALRFGFTFEGIFRDHMIIKGRSRDTAWFAMLEADWPARKAAFERWLAPDNFDADGTQRTKLAALSGADA
jgi:RimJ/RimL family protein N-acetyltransferase